ncbi:PhoH family protein [Clostridium botulinum]|uniref:PhoH family protein n=1 Tax=Clostridium botulinum TaxID=1491 RepID=UPI000773FF09|nr:PhoH family protein [Clostridium botulinum]
MDKIKFYDTNALLKLYDKLDTIDFFYTSSMVLHELEHIKVSKNKDAEVRYQARQVSKFLKDNIDKYECIIVQTKHYELLEELNLDTSNDNLIIACAKQLEIENKEQILFITNDICCWNIANKIFDLKTETLNDKNEDNYRGYVEKQFTDEELANFYQYGLNKNTYGLLENEYLIVKDANGYTVDSYKWNGEKLMPTEYKNMKSNMLGSLKALDRYQMCVLDSFQTNQITMVKGKAGSGKSYLSMGYLFSQLEKGKLEKIIIFTNPIATRGASKLGYYPGTKDEKLLDSNIGNFLCSKLGDKLALELLLQQNKIVLLPMSDIRGYDTTGMKAGIYITESQNMSIDMMKLALQRIGQDCICIIDGDYNTQVDDINFSGANNGMKRMSEVFRGQNFYGEVELNNIYRSKIAEIADLM